MKIKPKLIKKQNKLGFKTKKKKASIDQNQMKLIYGGKIIIKDNDYYYSNSIARASKTMSNCRNEKINLKSTGTEG